MQPKEQKALIKAVELIQSYGILLYVPGCFDIADADDAIEYVNNPEQFGMVRNPDRE